MSQFNSSRHAFAVLRAAAMLEVRPDGWYVSTRWNDHESLARQAIMCLDRHYLLTGTGRGLLLYFPIPLMPRPRR